MALSPANPPAKSPAPNPNAFKTKTLTILNNNNNHLKPKTPPPSDTATPDPPTSDEPLDLSEQINDQIRRKYVKGRKLGEGTYAIVYEGHLVADSSQLVAIKKIKTIADYKDGLTMDAIREVKFLQELSHPNIITLHAVFSTRDQNLNLVLEHLPRGDLEVLMKAVNDVQYGLGDIKAWMGMLSKAVWFCHENFILHRDIKLNNLLIAADGEVKLADFGLARSFADPYRPMTSNVITRWYRPPELLYGTRHYSGTVDVWSMGVVFAELVLRQFWLPGNTDIEQLTLIGQVFGTPTEDNWPGVSNLDHYFETAKEDVKPPLPKEYWDSQFGLIGQQGIDLLKSMMVLDPRKRATARRILEHPWWKAEPKPTRKENLPKQAGGPKQMAEDLKRRGGEVENGRADKVARKLDFSAMKK